MPLISDVEIDKRGDLIIAIMDRDGLQWGSRNHFPNAATYNTRQASGRSEGDIIKACKLGTGYVLEGKDDSCPYSTEFTQSHFATGDGEFFFGDEGPDGSTNDYLYHYEASYGTLAYNKLADEVILVAMDPFKWFSAGLFWLSPTTGGQVGLRELYATGSRGTTTFAKTTGLGEVEMMCKVIPIEIGNRVWNDLNGDGIQDPNEPGIAGVVVMLYDGASTYTTTTNENGEYCFDDSVVTNGVLFHHIYELTIALNDAALADLGLSAPTLKNVPSGTALSTAVDSDAFVDGGDAKIMLTTGGSGIHMHHLDFGFVP